MNAGITEYVNLKNVVGQMKEDKKSIAMIQKSIDSLNQLQNKKKLQSNMTDKNQKEIKKSQIDQYEKV